MGNWITDPERVELLMDLHNYEIALEWLKKNQMPRCKACGEKYKDRKSEYYRKWQYLEWALELTRMYLEDEIDTIKRKLENSEWRMR